MFYHSLSDKNNEVIHNEGNTTDQIFANNKFVGFDKELDMKKKIIPHTNAPATIIELPKVSEQVFPRFTHTLLGSQRPKELNKTVVSLNDLSKSAPKYSQQERVVVDTTISTSTLLEKTVQETGIDEML